MLTKIGMIMSSLWNRLRELCQTRIDIWSISESMPVSELYFSNETLTYLIAKGIFLSAIFSPFIISLPHVRRQVRTVHSRILSLNATNFFHVPDSTRSARSKVANAVRRGVAAHELDDDKDTY